LSDNVGVRVFEQQTADLRVAAEMPGFHRALTVNWTTVECFA
jgi:hypothetical protein